MGMFKDYELDTDKMKMNAIAAALSGVMGKENVFNKDPMGSTGGIVPEPSRGVGQVIGDIAGNFKKFTMPNTTDRQTIQQNQGNAEFFTNPQNRADLLSDSGRQQYDEQAAQFKTIANNLLQTYATGDPETSAAALENLRSIFNNAPQSSGLPQKAGDIFYEHVKKREKGAPTSSVRGRAFSEEEKQANNDGLTATQMAQRAVRAAGQNPALLKMDLTAPYASVLMGMGKEREKSGIDTQEYLNKKGGTDLDVSKQLAAINLANQEKYRSGAVDADIEALKKQGFSDDEIKQMIKEKYSGIRYNIKQPHETTPAEISKMTTEAWKMYKQGKVNDFGMPIDKNNPPTQEDFYQNFLPQYMEQIRSQTGMSGATVPKETTAGTYGSPTEQEDPVFEKDFSEMQAAMSRMKPEAFKVAVDRYKKQNPKYAKQVDARLKNLTLIRK